MNKSEILAKLEEILEDAKVGILATVDNEKKPHMRWMVPALIKGRPNALFSVTSPAFSKKIDLSMNPDVEWIIQTRALDKIINLRGKVNILDNPSIKSEILEKIGKRLTMFWKLNEDPQSLIVLETVIEEATLFFPMKGERTKILF